MIAREMDVKIAEWLGLKVIKLRDHNFVQERYNYDVVAGRTVDNMPNTYPVPNYTTSAADAIALFPLLLKKGFVPALFIAHSVPDRWQCDIAKSADYEAVARGIEPTIALAISAATLRLIESI